MILFYFTIKLQSNEIEFTYYTYHLLLYWAVIYRVLTILSSYIKQQGWLP
jgi:hypothetical protein